MYLYIYTYIRIIYTRLFNFWLGSIPPFLVNSLHENPTKSYAITMESHSITIKSTIKSHSNHHPIHQIPLKSQIPLNHHQIPVKSHKIPLKSPSNPLKITPKLTSRPSLAAPSPAPSAAHRRAARPPPAWRRARGGRWALGAAGNLARGGGKMEIKPIGNWEIVGKTHRKIGKLWENPLENGKLIGKPAGKIIGKSWKTHRKGRIIGWRNGEDQRETHKKRRKNRGKSRNDGFIL